MLVESNFAGEYLQLGKKKKIWQQASKHSTTAERRERGITKDLPKMAKKVDVVRQKAFVKRDLRKSTKASGSTWSTQGAT
jgi:hypothetical protein